MTNIESLTKEDVEKEIEIFEEMGFIFFVDAHACKDYPFYVPDRVKLPNGRIFDEKELGNELEKDSTSKMLKTASYLFDLCFSEQYGDERFSHCSFDGDKDLENCRIKYASKSP